MSVPRLKSELAVASKRLHREPTPANQQRVREARRDLAAAKLEAYIERVVAGAPELTPEQASRLSALLGGTSASAGSRDDS